MDKNLLSQCISSDTSSDKLLADELHAQLRSELDKPLKSRDFEKINQLTLDIRRLSESDNDINLKNQNGINYVKNQFAENKKSSRKFSPARIIGSVACCFAIVAGVNAYSMSTLGMNFFSAIVNFSKGAVSLDFSNTSDNSENADSDSYDKFGIKEKCADYGVVCTAPTFMPSEFELSDFFCEKLTESVACSFYFSSSDEKTLNITVEQYADSQDIPSVLIPNKEMSLQQSVINNNLVYILDENDCYTAVYSSGNTVYLFYSDGLSYDTFEKIIASMK